MEDYVMADTINSLANQLEKKMDEAYSWGSQNKWPVMEDYPQWKAIQKIGKKLHALGGESAMREAIDIASQSNAEYPGMLNYFFRGIGEWLP